MSINEIRSHLVSKIYIVVINIFSHNWVIQSYRVEAPLNTISCGVLLTGGEESGVNNFALSENQAICICTGGANIFIFVIR